MNCDTLSIITDFLDWETKLKCRLINNFFFSVIELSFGSIRTNLKKIIHDHQSAFSTKCKMCLSGQKKMCILLQCIYAQNVSLIEFMLSKGGLNFKTINRKNIGNFYKHDKFGNYYTMELSVYSPKFAVGKHLQKIDNDFTYDDNTTDAHDYGNVIISLEQYALKYFRENKVSDQSKLEMIKMLIKIIKREKKYPLIKPVSWFYVSCLYHTKEVTQWLYNLHIGDSDVCSKCGYEYIVKTNKCLLECTDAKFITKKLALKDQIGNTFYDYLVTTLPFSLKVISAAIEIDKIILHKIFIRVCELHDNDIIKILLDSYLPILEQSTLEAGFNIVIGKYDVISAKLLINASKDSNTVSLWNTQLMVKKIFFPLVNAVNKRGDAISKLLG